MFLCDYHFHTEMSFDGEGRLTDVARAAAEKGLCELCVTDHYECGGFYSRKNKSIAAMRDAYLKAVAMNRDDITLRFGVELGAPLHGRGTAEVALAEGKFDFVIASVHNVRNHLDFYEIDYSDPGLDRILDGYYDEILEIIRWGKFDVLGHINYFERYAARDGVSLEMSRYYDRLSEIFLELVRAGKGLEINAAGLFAAVGKAQPDAEVLKLYKNCGGKIITVGSDSHAVQNIGRGIPEALDILRKAGFDQITVYENRTPRFIPI